MKKIIISMTVALTVVSMLAIPAFASGKSGPGGKPDLAGKSNVGHVSLVEKNPNDWGVVEGGACGQFNYKLSGEGANTEVSGVFNGHGLIADEDYSLIYYPEPAPNPWPAGGIEVFVIGEGTANEEEDVHIAGSAIIGEPDKQPLGGDYDYQLGDKIWLVLSDDLSVTTYDDGEVHLHIVNWNPAEYLFEDDLINTALLLVQKDSSDWSVVEDGAWGSYNYELSRGGKATMVSGTFKGYRLEEDTDYTLIYYPEIAPNPWENGEYEVVVIGQGMTDGEGYVEITGKSVIGFPDEQPSVGDYVGQTGDKIWLVLSDDLDEGVMNAWNPNAYLFEANLINPGK